MAANNTAEVPTFKLVLVGDGGTGTFTTTTMCSFLLSLFSLLLLFMLRVLKKNEIRVLEIFRMMMIIHGGLKDQQHISTFE